MDVRRFKSLLRKHGFGDRMTELETLASRHALLKERFLKEGSSEDYAEMTKLDKSIREKDRNLDTLIRAKGVELSERGILQQEIQAVEAMPEEALDIPAPTQKQAIPSPEEAMKAYSERPTPHNFKKVVATREGLPKSFDEALRQKEISFRASLHNTESAMLRQLSEANKESVDAELSHLDRLAKDNPKEAAVVNFKRQQLIEARARRAEEQELEAEHDAVKAGR